MESSHTPMTCQQIVEVITDYLDNRMAAEDRQRFEDHVAACDGCAAYLEQMRETIRLTGRLSEEELAPEQRDGLLKAFRGLT